ncbi:hypothetical protein GCM10020358_42830 [Amorphoplanes nipponensis]|uniref:Uncharacterized protein n=1 Tax=Actinoplanes nipponensis TaxID=135950 RepID=A0A919MJJ4_9ACTN|nr:hypothetical protein Ani05nite_10600 [Actinoplanes nipponensis]
MGIARAGSVVWLGQVGIARAGGRRRAVGMGVGVGGRLDRDLVALGWVRPAGCFKIRPGSQGRV